jgi:hypothetical protein
LSIIAQNGHWSFLSEYAEKKIFFETKIISTTLAQRCLRTNRAHRTNHSHITAWEISWGSYAMPPVNGFEL